MGEKNRFSKLLEYLMSTAELKNYVLAKELQYDVSYISKWLSGRMIPSEKTEKKILEGISRCIVDSASEAGRASLLTDYQIESLEDLKLAIFDNLEAEYFYVRDLQKNTGTDVAAKTFYFPELTMQQYIAKMRHPVLRRVKSLNVVAAMDLMYMGHEHRFQIARIENEHIPGQKGYPDVHYSLVIDMKLETWDYIYDTIFLMNLLSNNAYINFQLYGSAQAAGKMVFAVKDDYVISGMLADRSRCMAVVVSEDEANCNALYRNIKALCIREKLLFRRTTMEDMLLRDDYVQTELAMNQRWMMGHLTEHFLPDELFEELAEQVYAGDSLEISREALRDAHRLTRNIMQSSHIRLMMYESAFSSLVVRNELDFYNRKVCLTEEQKLRYMEGLLSLCKEHDNLELKLVYGQFVSDFEYTNHQCIFLTDTISYIRLGSKNPDNNLLIVNRADMRKVFDRSFERFWNDCGDVVISDKNAILDYIQHVVRGIQIVSEVKKKP